jgi:H+/Cl- antiporter ClcA
MLSRSTWLLLAMAALVAATSARFIWSQEFRQFEARTLDAWGVPMPARVAGIGILLGLLGWQYYSRSKRDAARLGQPVIRRSVALFALGSLGLVLGLAFYASRG